MDRSGHPQQIGKQQRDISGAHAARPDVTAAATVLTSDRAALKRDLKRKPVRFYRVKPLSIFMAATGFMLIVALSILLSTLFGQSLDQFAFTGGFSFSAGGTSALLALFYRDFIAETADGTPFFHVYYRCHF